MTKLLFPAFMVVPLAAFSLLAVAGPSPDGDCAAQFESLNAEWRTLWPAWRGTPGSDLIPALERHAKAFGAVAGFDPCQLLALQQANCPGQALLIAELGDGASR